MCVCLWTTKFVSNNMPQLVHYVALKLVLFAHTTLSFQHTEALKIIAEKSEISSTKVIFIDDLHFILLKWNLRKINVLIWNIKVLYSPEKS